MNGVEGVAGSAYGQNAATKPGQTMRKAQAIAAMVALTWAFMVSRLSESNRRPIHYE